MRTRDILRAARKDGTAAGISAASWVFDGNTSRATYSRILHGIQDGDPEILDSLHAPSLSGEWADDPTPSSLCREYGLTIDRDPDGDLMADMCTAWEDAASAAFWTAVERAALIGYHE